jgi:hypothetical protein
MDESLGTATTPKARDKNTRMLIELESFGGRRKTGSAGTWVMWLSAAALVAAAGGAWWSQQRPALALDSDRSLGGRAGAAPAASATAKVAGATTATSAATASKSTAGLALPASAPVGAAPSVARIETAATAGAALAVPATTTLALAAAAIPAPITTSPQKSDASDAPPPTKARVDRASKTPAASKSAKTAKQKKLAKQQLAKAKKDRSGSATPTRLAKAAPAADRSTTTGAAPASKEADILLLSALLAHVSRDAQGAPTGTQAQQTIAQIVQRCEARGGKDTVETSECRRRICDGYWGKAQACPANLAPKKD